MSAFRSRRRRLTGAAAGRAGKKAKPAATVSAEALLRRARVDVCRVYDSVENLLLDQGHLRKPLSFSQEEKVIDAAAADLVEQRRSRSGGGEPLIGARAILESRMRQMHPLRRVVAELVPANYYDVDARGRSKLVRRSVQDVMAKNPAVYYDPHRSGVRWTETSVAAADGVHEFKFGYDADAPLHASSDEGTSSFGGLRFHGPLVVRACRDGDAVDVTRELLKLASAELKRGGWRVQEEHGVQLLSFLANTL